MSIEIFIIVGTLAEMRSSMISNSGTGFDIVLITAEEYEDHPLSPAGVIARVLDARGYKVGIVETPKGKDDIAKLGVPKLFWGITSGSIDSMLNNYTPLKRSRLEDEHSDARPMPDRALIVYANWIKQIEKAVPIVLGGIEASLRRFAHYDYWNNDIRRCILFDTRADILVYGNGEKQVLEIAQRLKEGKDLVGIRGTCIKAREMPQGFELLPSFKDVVADKKAFCKMTVALSNRKDLAQGYDNNFILQYKYPDYTTADLDWIFSLGFKRNLRRGSALELARFSVVIHRGCLGRCNFCSIALHQGDKVISRSEQSILYEISSFSRVPGWKGYVDDLGGPSANMYGMDCVKACNRGCIGCKNLDVSHSRLLDLMRKVRALPGVKKVFVRSGIRYDLAVESKEYIKELSEHHISGTLKIAPEHFDKDVLALMNKDNSRFDEFVELFNKINDHKGQTLRYYLMIGHPGDDEVRVRALKEKGVELGNIENFQMFTPTPMSISSCMYWTGLNPFTLEPIKVVYDFHTKKELKRIMLGGIEESHDVEKDRPSRRKVR
jgi:uncharacterized radical SAM protein YgiQ